MKKYSKRDQRALMVWALACAKRVLPLFAAAAPTDDRPRAALRVGRTWLRTGVFHMQTIRDASLASHAAARQVRSNPAAAHAAHAAGQAVATAHVVQHAYGAAYYALRAIAARDSERGEARINRERDWQARQLPPRLRDLVMSRITLARQRGILVIRLRKGRGF